MKNYMVTQTFKSKEMKDKFSETVASEVGGCKVTAASFDDEIKRVEQFEEDALTKGK